MPVSCTYKTFVCQWAVHTRHSYASELYTRHSYASELYRRHSYASELYTRHSYASELYTRHSYASELYIQDIPMPVSCTQDIPMPVSCTQALWMISSFRREVDGNCALLGYYAASSGNFLPTFRDNSSFPSTGFRNPKSLKNPLEMGPIGCPETSVRNYHYSLPNNPVERSSPALWSYVIWL